MDERKLYVDDIRDPPAGDLWDLARTYEQAIDLLYNNQYDILSLDHDLADVHYKIKDWSRSTSVDELAVFDERTGYDIALWLAERKNDGFYVPPVILCHSANPVGKERILGVVKRYLS